MCPTRSCALLLLLILCSGCSTLSRAGYGDRGTFNDGVLTTRFDQEVGITYDLAVKALADLDIPVLDAAREETNAQITARRPADGAPIEIALAWRRNDTTGAVIKVGQQGDELYSSAIVEAINKRLSEWHREHDKSTAALPGRESTGY
jgi:hypothetical protein